MADSQNRLQQIAARFGYRISSLFITGGTQQRCIYDQAA